MPNFVSGSSGSVYAKDNKSSTRKEEDEILAAISSQTTRADNDAKKPSAINKKGGKEKQKSSLDLFKEELRRLNEERDEQRNKLKQSLDAPTSGNSQSKHKQQPVPLPLKPDPRCPTALTLKVNLNPKDKDAPSTGSFDTGDPTTTNLYVGNLNPIVTENDLCDIFGKFGPLASIKIMWPRTDEERARNRNSGFVAYMSRVDADRALKTLAGMEFKNYEMKLGWSKAVPLPKDPVFIPKELQELLKPLAQSGMPFNAQLHESDVERGYCVPTPYPRAPATNSPESPSETYREFMEVFERSTVHVHVPPDRQILDKIHKTIEFCLREGPVFEAIIIARESKNPHYRFLFEHQSLEHIYYRWKLYSLLHGEDPHHWHTEPFRMFEGGPSWRPPPLNPYFDGMPIELVERLTGINCSALAGGRSASNPWRKIEVVSEPSGSANGGADSAGGGGGSSSLKFKGKFDGMKVKMLTDMLARLLPTRASVGSAMLFCINHSDASEEIVNNVEQAICSSSAAQQASTKIAQLFLISDVLHNSTAGVPNASSYRKGFQAKLANIFEKLRDYLQTHLEEPQEASKFKRQVTSVLSSWNYFHIFESKFLVSLSDILLGSTGSEPLVQEALANDEQQVESATSIDDHLDGAPIDNDTLAECLEGRGLSLRWYKTLELSDDELDDNDTEPLSADDAGDNSQRASCSKKFSDLLSTSDSVAAAATPAAPKASDKFRPSKWEMVNQEAEKQQPARSPSKRLEPMKPLTSSEVLKQQMLRQEAASSADEYESLGSSEDDDVKPNKS